MSDIFERLKGALRSQFTLERELASGGMGVLYLARDLRLGRTVVIKTIREECRSPETDARFLREGQLLARLEPHPNLPQVFGADVVDGIPICVMQYLQGRSLSERLREGPLGQGELLRLGQDLLAGLAAVHRARLAHRDVTPGNIVLLPDRAVLIDFGLARVDSATATALTAPDVVMGTPGFQPPEPNPGQPGDVYCAGAVLYLAATGKRWICRPAVRRVDLQPVPRRVRHALRRALQPDPERRWSNASRFAEAWRRPRLVPVALGALAAIGTVALLLGAVWWRSGGPAHAPVDLGILPFRSECSAVRPLAEELPADLEHFLDWFPEWRVARLVRPEHATWALSATVRCTDPPTLAVTLQDSGGLADAWTPAAGDALSMSRGMADWVVQRLWPASAPLYHGLAGPEGHTPALHAYFAGREAFQRDDWFTAEARFTDALRIDSTFALAAWQRLLVRKWRRAPFQDDLKSLATRKATDLPELVRLLIRAELMPPGGARLARFQEAVARYPRDGDAALLLANETLTRGPLLGIPLDSGLTLMTAAEQKRAAALAPILDHLVMGDIRLGRALRAAEALRRRLALTGQENPDEASVAGLLLLGWAERFTPPLGRLLRWLEFRAPGGDLVEQLAERHRLASVFFDLPTTQRALAKVVLTHTPLVARRVNGFQGLGLADLALGQGVSALAAFDTAAQLSGDPVLMRQALAWRVVPAALGYPVVAERDLDRARRELQFLEDVTGERPFRLWVSIMLALGRGDTTGARVTLDSLDRLAAPDAGLRWWIRLLHAEAAARAGQPGTALGLAPDHDAVDGAPGPMAPFQRSAWHLWRARWLAQTGSVADADRVLVWYENSDLHGWPEGPVQAGEVDAVFGVLARLERSALALSQGDRPRGCALRRRVRELWQDADPAVLALIRQRAASSGACD
jgi:tRNA A-37 threonylcarbamoyl transferase component Bud32